VRSHYHTDLIYDVGVMLLLCPFIFVVVTLRIALLTSRPVAVVLSTIYCLLMKFFCGVVKSILEADTKMSHTLHTSSAAKMTLFFVA
jgi:hypothetical protein